MDKVKKLLRYITRFVQNEKYPNAKLAQAYFEVMAQDSSEIAWKKYKNDQKSIRETEGNIQAYFKKHNDLNDLNIPGISKKTKKGVEKREILESILLKGKEAVKEKFQNLKINSDALKRTMW